MNIFEELKNQGNILKIARFWVYIRMFVLFMSSCKLYKTERNEEITNKIKLKNAKELTIFSLFILILPFFQTCSDKNISENSMLKNSPLLEEVKIDSITELNGKKYNLSFEELTKKKKKATTDFVKLKKELTLNGYQIGKLFVEYIETSQ